MLFDTMSIMAYAVGIIVLYVFCLFFSGAVKLLFKTLINIIFGGILVYVFNFAGGILGITLGVNIFTSTTAGILGIPGILLLFAIKAFL